MDLTTGHVTKFSNRRRAEGISNASINRETSILRRGLQLGLQQEPPLVIRAIHIPKLEENNVRHGFVDAAQYKRLLVELPERLKLLLVICYHTGIRKGEALRIHIDQIDLQHDQIRLHAGETKNGEARVLPIYGEMRTLLTAAIAKRHQDAKRTGEFPCPLLFHEDGHPIKSFFKAWRSACKRAGVPGQLFHDLRRSAVRNMERAGISRSVAMKISGHKTEGVYRRYAIVNEQDIADAGRKLEAGTVTKTVTIRRRRANAGR